MKSIMAKVIELLQQVTTTFGSYKMKERKKNQAWLSSCSQILDIVCTTIKLDIHVIERNLLKAHEKLAITQSDNRNEFGV